MTCAKHLANLLMLVYRATLPSTYLQDSCKRRFKSLCIGATRCLTASLSLRTTFSSVWLGFLLVLCTNETFCDVYIIRQQSHHVRVFNGEVTL